MKIIADLIALALPGFLMMIKEVDFQTQGTPIAEGGAGMIILGKLINQPVIKRADNVDKCVIKVLKGNYCVQRL
jgi:hypothetical protein